MPKKYTEQEGKDIVFSFRLKRGTYNLMKKTAKEKGLILTAIGNKAIENYLKQIAAVK